MVQRQIKRSFVAGLIVIIPVTSVILMFDWLIGTVSSFVPIDIFNLTSYSPLNAMIGLVAAVTLSSLIVVILGFVFKTYLGKKLETRMDDLFERVPVIGTIYSMTKSTSREIFDGSEKFKDPVKVETGDIRRTAFRTGRTTEGREVLFMPTSPNVTSGFVIEVEEKNVIESDETTEEALQSLLSAGFSGKSD